MELMFWMAVIGMGVILVAMIVEVIEIRRMHRRRQRREMIQRYTRSIK